MKVSTTGKVPPIVRLVYKPGETIIKGGDYGISIYVIVEGLVEIYIESGENETRLGTAGPGETIGEMIFLTGAKSRRSASVRAVEYTVLESLHPDRISHEYSQVPLVVKTMVRQTIRRLKQMNQMIAELDAAKARTEEWKQHDPWTQHRKFYRKKMNLEVMYRPLDDKRKLTMWGAMTDLSQTGMRLEVTKANLFKCSHEPGDKFFASTFLPNGQRIDLKMKIARVYDTHDKNVVSLGLIFFDMNENLNKKLGFFLMR